MTDGLPLGLVTLAAEEEDLKRQRHGDRRYEGEARQHRGRVPAAAPEHSTPLLTPFLAEVNQGQDRPSVGPCLA